jgi:hypothetical protein
MMILLGFARGRNRRGQGEQGLAPDAAQREAVRR